MSTYKLTLSALLVAIGTLTAGVVYIPAGVSKCFPVQHCINVLAAVLLGPGPATMIAFLIACLRNVMGTGSLLAFPGGMIGALCAGLLYRHFRRIPAAMVGEIFGTGILGGLVAWVIAAFVVLHPAVPHQHRGWQHYRGTGTAQWRAEYNHGKTQRPPSGGG